MCVEVFVQLTSILLPKREDTPQAQVHFPPCSQATGRGEVHHQSTSKRKTTKGVNHIIMSVLLQTRLNRNNPPLLARHSFAPTCLVTIQLNTGLSVSRNWYKQDDMAAHLSTKFFQKLEIPASARRCSVLTIATIMMPPFNR